jgi:hypothetical protein
MTIRTPTNATIAMEAICPIEAAECRPRHLVDYPDATVEWGKCDEALHRRCPGVNDVRREADRQAA